MIRWEGESILNQSFILERDEMLFIIANEVSLTAKNGPLDVLVKAGVEIDEFWESNTVGSVK